MRFQLFLCSCLLTGTYSAPGRRSPSGGDELSLQHQPYEWLGWRSIARVIFIEIVDADVESRRRPVAGDNAVSPTPCHQHRRPLHAPPHWPFSRDEDDSNLPTKTKQRRPTPGPCTTRCLPGTNSDCLTSCAPAKQHQTPTSTMVKPTKTTDGMDSTPIAETTEQSNSPPDDLNLAYHPMPGMQQILKTPERTAGAVTTRDRY
ncbi:hypothetical protein BDZ85DRAFT_117943 [Elsinoe ampelina]|uniref:Secreted protein n=1 Tax=Elsinoe ampelina TaxID=302913 RepID=A0A6A6GB53_9PEZI|nr:hypothetical protein BDZ85DRAFT_117943 [Elsinoe ampelina]